MSVHKQNNFYYMFSALLVFLVLMPILEDAHAIPDALAQPVSITCLLLIGVWSLRESKWAFRAGIALAAISIFFNTAGYHTSPQALGLQTLAPFAAFLILAAVSALGQVVYGTAMNANRLIGAVCVYLLIGVLWATLYSGAYKLDPGAFAGIPQDSSGDLGVAWVYYSFVTLTTLGYGDILPLSVVARVLAFSQAILGVFYMATLVAMLVSAYAAEATRDQ